LQLRNNGPLSPQNIDSRNYLLDFIIQNYGSKNWDTSYIKKIETEILNFSRSLTKKWSGCNRTLNIFMNKYKEWLETEFKFPDIKNDQTSKTVGRPSKEFSDLKNRTKSKRVKAIVDGLTTPELIFATQTKLYKAGKRDCAELLKEATITPTRASKIKTNIKNHNKPIPYSDDEALCCLIDKRLTKNQYIGLRLEAKQRNANIYPSYNSILQAKQRCYPDKCFVSESASNIPLQNLLDHTVQRIFQIPTIQIISQSYNFEMIYKWGCDGSGGHSRYKQIFKTQPDKTDADIVMASLVPLQLRCKRNESYFTIWENPRYSSTRFCRPIMFEYIKETKESTRRLVDHIENQIKTLIPTTITINNSAEIQIEHTLIFSMIDGKVIFLYEYINIIIDNL